MEGKKNVLIESILLLIISFGVFFEGLRLIRSGSNVIQDVMGPGTYIIVLGVLLIIITLTHITLNYLSILRRKRKHPSDAEEQHGKRVNLTVLAMVTIIALYIVLIQFLGYLVATPIFFLLLFRAAGVNSWGRNVALTVILSASYYLIFVHFCSVIFPRGLLFG